MKLFLYESLSGSNDPAPPELLAQGLEMRDAVLQDLLALPGVQTLCAHSRAAPPPSAAMSGAGWVSAEPGESAPAFVGRAAADCDAAWIIAPESGGQLATLRGVVGEQRWVGCSLAAIRTASSKRATLERLHVYGVPTPLALERAERWVVKPDDGAGGQDIRVHADRTAALADRARREGATVEPFVEGDTLSVALLAAHGSARVLACNRQRVDIDAQGLLSYRGVDAAALDRDRDARLPALRVLAQQVVRALPGLRGFVGIDVIWHQQLGAVAVEVNPRVTCAYAGLSGRLGINVAGEVLRMHGPLQPTATPARRRSDVEPGDVER